METLLIDIARGALALVGGLCVGYGFGLIQAFARRRYERRQAAGQLKSGWAIMPGSFTRIALLLVALALVQAVCPALFVDGVQWWVSAGVALGYGAQLFLQLRAHRATLARG